MLQKLEVQCEAQVLELVLNYIKSTDIDEVVTRRLLEQVSPDRTEGYKHFPTPVPWQGLPTQCKAWVFVHLRNRGGMLRNTFSSTASRALQA